MIQVSTFQC